MRLYLVITIIIEQRRWLKELIKAYVSTHTFTSVGRTDTSWSPDCCKMKGNLTSLCRNWTKKCSKAKLEHRENNRARLKYLQEHGQGLTAMKRIWRGVKETGRLNAVGRVISDKVQLRKSGLRWGELKPRPEGAEGKTELRQKRDEHRSWQSAWIVTGHEWILRMFYICSPPFLFHFVLWMHIFRSAPLNMTQV